jgi:hypothetical protein
MGRSFESIRLAANEITGRWERVAWSLPGSDRDCALRVVAMAKRHSSEGFYSFDDPLESVFFSALIELLKEQGRRHVDH